MVKNTHAWRTRIIDRSGDLEPAEWRDGMKLAHFARELVRVYFLKGFCCFKKGTPEAKNRQAFRRS
jgi:hypothetical protein